MILYWFGVVITAGMLFCARDQEKVTFGKVLKGVLICLFFPVAWGILIGTVIRKFDIFSE